MGIFPDMSNEAGQLSIDLYNDLRNSAPLTEAKTGDVDGPTDQRSLSLVAPSTATILAEVASTCGLSLLCCFWSPEGSPSSGASVSASAPCWLWCWIHCRFTGHLVSLPLSSSLPNTWCPSPAYPTPSRYFWNYSRILTRGVYYCCENAIFLLPPQDQMQCLVSDGTELNWNLHCFRLILLLFYQLFTHKAVLASP